MTPTPNGPTPRTDIEVKRIFSDPSILYPSSAAFNALRMHAEKLELELASRSKAVGTGLAEGTTPRTDEAEYEGPCAKSESYGPMVVDPEFARQLERELAGSRDRLRKLEGLQAALIEWADADPEASGDLGEWLDKIIVSARALSTHEEKG